MFGSYLLSVCGGLVGKQNNPKGKGQEDREESDRKEERLRKVNRKVKEVKCPLIYLQQKPVQGDIYQSMLYLCM